MDKKTLLAVVLSVVVISVGFMLQNVLWPTEPVDPATVAEQPVGDTGGGTTGTSESTPTVTAPESSGSSTTTTVVGSNGQVAAIESDQELSEVTYTIDTEYFIATFSNRGGELVSLKLREQLEDNEPVEMVFSGDSDVRPFFVSFGGPDAQPIDVLFKQNVRGPYSVSYERDFLAPEDAEGNRHPFKLIKTYTFDPIDYMFELEVTIENSVNDYPNLDWNGIAYTLGYGPQIGPEFDSLGGRGEFRFYYTHEDGKRQTNRVGRSGEVVVNSRWSWAGIVGKYFVLMAIADDADYTLTFREPRVEGVPSSSFLYLSRPFIRSSKNSDIYRFYMGPKTRKLLSSYNNPQDNPYSLADRDMQDAVDSSALLGWLETILKFFLDLFYRIIPNYGVAIILLTIFVKALLFPITRKSYESTSKMQAVNPKITEIREKYKDNPNRMNQEMAALYKREGVSPLGGCLPLLLQMPIFLAMYRVMSSHFALRGEPFVWWITDLSEPDTILSFGDFTVPLLGWTALRLLPILFVATQIISTKFMQQPGAQSNKNMKLMTQLLPVFFFFVLYNVPSGLLIYWIMTNVLTAVQQMAISRYRTTHPGDEDAADGKGGTGKGSGPKSGPKAGPKPGSGPSKGSGGSGSGGPGGGKKKKPKA